MKFPPTKLGGCLSGIEQELEESQNQRDARVEQLWAKLDPAGTGELDLKGLRRGLARIDHPMKHADGMVRQIMHKLDRNKDGRIQYDEFRIFIEHAERQLMTLFKSIDRDRNGRLDKNELREAFKRAGLTVPSRKLSEFFGEMDINNDGFISFEEWRDFLMFMPIHNGSSPLEAVMSFYSSIVTVTAEGDSTVSDETLTGLGYFLAGAIAGGVSRTATAPLDRLKVYLLVNTDTKTAAGSNPQAVRANLRQGKIGLVVRNSVRPIADACRVIYGSGGIRAFFAGNALNVVKIMPETAIKFGSYEFAKRLLATFEGHGDPRQINPYSKFVAGGVAGMVAQFCVYPLDTLKFRLQCEAVKGGPTGTELLRGTARKMAAEGFRRSAYRGVTMGLVGMFPYSAIDMGIFELLKKTYCRYRARYEGVHEEDVQSGNVATGIIGATSGAIGATVVYPLNVVRTRLQTQGTIMHRDTYTGIIDVTRKTLAREGWRGLYKGLTPNLLKVAPALSITWIVYENSKAVLGLQ